MLRYSHIKNIVSAPDDIHNGKELLSATNSRACILVVGPHLAMQPNVDEGRGDSSAYLKKLLKGMVEWCIQKSIIDQPDTIKKFCQLPYRESLAHAGNELEEYLIEEQQLQHCLAEALRSTSQLTHAHQELAHIPFKGYISTTYDTFIEATYEQVHQRKLPKFYTSSISAAIKACQDERQFMLKLYGDIDDPASIVFGHRLNKGLSGIDEQDALSELLSMSTVVFLGFEETDPDLLYLKGLLHKNQPFHLLLLPHLQTLVEQHYKPISGYWWEDSSNNINAYKFHPSFSNIAVLPEIETHTIPTANTSSYTQRPRGSSPSLRTREMPSKTRTNQAPIEIYTAYTQSDERVFLKIKEQLSILQRQGWPISCLEDEVIYSTSWQRNDHLTSTANLILLLVSSAFLDSDFCYCDQMYLAVERHRTDNLCYVIPIILHQLHPLQLEKTPFGTLDFLPTNGKTISRNPKAYSDITGYLLEKIQRMAYYR